MSSPASTPPAPATPDAPRVAVVQDGARLHYVVPLALQRHGLLERMFTAWYAPPGSLSARLARLVGMVRPGIGRRMAERFNPELDPRRVVTCPTLIVRAAVGQRRHATPEQFWAWESAVTGSWVWRHGLGDATAVLGYVRNIDPELCARCRQRGLVTVADQIIAPAIIEHEQMQRELERWPGWHPPGRVPDWQTVDQVERRTWAALDHVTCASEYVRDGLMREGVAAERISVLPYPVEVGQFPHTDRRGHRGPLRVGFVGAVGLRKGAGYFLKVAQALRSANVQFVMVGPAHLTGAALAELKGAVELVGSVPRSTVLDWLARFDVLLYPSTCEGSAGAVMEAMACGLPVVTSPETGSAVRDGVEGFVCPYDDVPALAERVQRLLGDEALRLGMGSAARARAEALGLSAYAAGLAGLVRRLHAARRAGG